MKKLIRAIIKIPATPVVITFHTLLIFGGYVTRFFEWVYEASEYDKQITAEIISRERQSIVKWFTTI